MKKFLLLIFLIFVIPGSFLRVNSEIKYDAYFEGFESTAFPPAGWISINVSGNVTWMIGYFAHSGIQAAVCAWQTSGFGEDWLITPRWSIQSSDSLVFWLRPFYSGFQPDSLSVRVSTTDSMMSSFTTRILYIAEGNGYPLGTIYQRYAVSLNAFAGQQIFIAFKHCDQNGDGIFIDDVAVTRQNPSLVTGIGGTVPYNYALYQNYPNPFNSMTNIHFSVPEVGRSSQTVTMKVFDITGKEVAILVNEVLQPGTYRITFDAVNFTSGVYFCQMKAGNFHDTKKLLLIK